MRTPKHPCDLQQLWACSLRSYCGEATGQSKKSPAGPGFKSRLCPGDLTVMLTHEVAVEMQPGEAGARQLISKCGFLLTLYHKLCASVSLEILAHFQDIFFNH